MKILVTGGTGYIGSHTIIELLKQKFEVVVFDNLENGHKEAIPKVKVYQGDLKTDLKLLDQVFKEEKPQAVIHFAAYIEAGESVINPQKFFLNNVGGSLNLFKAMLENQVLKIIFSSTAAVYGRFVKIPISEEEIERPENAYGESKLIVERILRWYAQAYGLSAIVLRYFNAAGASLDASIGPDYPEPTHLIIRACEAALGKRKNFKIFGNDYDTPDGTCIRDYIHVLDLASAHIVALKALNEGKKGFSLYNVGTGNGYSVLEIVNMVKKISGVAIEAPIVPRREGDAPVSIAKTDKIKSELGWEPKYSDLETIIKTAWNWHKNHPNGYGSPEV